MQKFLALIGGHYPDNFYLADIAESFPFHVAKLRVNCTGSFEEPAGRKVAVHCVKCEVHKELEGAKNLAVF